MTRRLILAIVTLSFLLLLLVRASSGAMTNPFMNYETLGSWIAALLTISVLSFLYGDNPFYRTCEHVLVGVTAAYWMVMGFWRTIVPNLLGNLVPEIPVYVFGMDASLDVSLQHRLIYSIPLLLGILLLMRLHPSGRAASSCTLAFVLGTSAGLRLVGHLEADFMAQIYSTVTPLIVVGEDGFNLGRTIDAILIASGVVCGLFYFFFSRRQDGVLGSLGKAGLWILLVTFGAGFGFTVMGRIALLVGRVEFLLQDWLRVI